MNRLLIFIVLSLLPALLWADVVEVDGINYSLYEGGIAAVYGGKLYAGDIVLPSSFEYQGTRYRVTSIIYAFHQCPALTSITIPGSVTYIDDVESFGFSPRLTSIRVDPGNSRYDSRNDCNAILETASNTLIHGCCNTQIPQGVIGIGYRAFAGCSGLTSLQIPEGVKTIGMNAFLCCSGLTSITLPSSLAFIENVAFSECSRLTSVELPAGLRSIGCGAFSDCSSLTSICIPEGVKVISEAAFFSCGALSALTLPRSVKVIGPIAFAHCIGLTTIVLHGETPPRVDADAFRDVDRSRCVLDVPEGSVAAYRTAEGWREFVHVVTHHSQQEARDAADDSVNVAHSAPAFTLAFDTIRLDSDRYGNFSLRTACKWRGNYYLLSNSFILRVSKNLDEVCAISKPEYYYAELFVKHDSLMIYCKNNGVLSLQYYLPEEDRWELIEEARGLMEPIRDDDAWRLYFRDVGEFGGRLRFVDKTTGQEYLYEINNERVIRYHDNYYLISNERIFRIHNPASYYAELILKEDEYELHEYPSIASCFASAFCLDDNLYVVANDKEETYIARLRDEELEYVFGLGQMWRFSYDVDYNLMPNQSDDKVLILHRALDDSSQGFLDIDGHHVRAIEILPCVGADNKY